MRKLKSWRVSMPGWRASAQRVRRGAEVMLRWLTARIIDQRLRDIKSDAQSDYHRIGTLLAGPTSPRANTTQRHGSQGGQMSPHGLSYH